jgi:thiamine biosynthesis protein ThiS
LTITLNGERFELAHSLTVAQLLDHLGIDARRVAVEHNLTVVKRAAFDTTLVQQDDQVEIVNLVGGGARTVLLAVAGPTRPPFSTEHS